MQDNNHKHISPELKLLCKDEWGNIRPSHCAGLINSYWKLLVKGFAPDFSFGWVGQVASVKVKCDKVQLVSKNYHY